MDSIKRQRGSVLLSTLLVMMALGYAGYYAMETAITGTRLASHEQTRLQAYHYAFNELKAQMQWLESNPNTLTQAQKSSPQSLANITFSTCPNTGDACLSSNVSYIGESLPPVGFSVTEFKGWVFELNTKAHLHQIGAASDQTRLIIFAIRRT